MCVCVVFTSQLFDAQGGICTLPVHETCENGERCQNPPEESKEFGPFYLYCAVIALSRGATLLILHGFKMSEFHHLFLYYSLHETDPLPHTHTHTCTHGSIGLDASSCCKGESVIP